MPKIWVFDKDPKKCARYYPDDEVLIGLQEGLKALMENKGKWGKWAHKRSQIWQWLYQLTNHLMEQALLRQLEIKAQAAKTILDYLWYAPNNLPCSPRGLKTKFPYATKKNAQISRTNQIVYTYRSYFNRTRPGAKWSTPVEEPFWYLGDID